LLQALSVMRPSFDAMESVCPNLISKLLLDGVGHAAPGNATGQVSAAPRDVLSPFLLVRFSHFWTSWPDAGKHVSNSGGSKRADSRHF
jgi:hypothetical protein